MKKMALEKVVKRKEKTTVDFNIKKHKKINSEEMHLRSMPIIKVGINEYDYQQDNGM